MGVGWRVRGFDLESSMDTPHTCRATTMAAEHKAMRSVGDVWNIAFGHCWRFGASNTWRKHRKSTYSILTLGGLGRRIAHHNLDVFGVAIFLAR